MVGGGGGEWTVVGGGWPEPLGLLLHVEPVSGRSGEVNAGGEERLTWHSRIRKGPRGAKHRAEQFTYSSEKLRVTVLSVTPGVFHGTP